MTTSAPSPRACSLTATRAAASRFAGPSGDWTGLKGSGWSSAPLFHALGAAGFGGFATVLLIDAAVSPAANGWVTLGSAARSSFAFSADGYAPKGLAKVNKFGIPWASLALALAISAVFMLPFPSWYELVSVVSAGLVLSYLMASPIMQVLRHTAPHTPRPWRLPAAGILAPAGYVCGLFIVYVTGFSSLIQLMIITLAGVAVYGAYTAVLGTTQLDQVLDNGTGDDVATSIAQDSAVSTPSPAEPARDRPQ